MNLNCQSHTGGIERHWQIVTSYRASSRVHQYWDNTSHSDLIELRYDTRSESYCGLQESNEVPLARNRIDNPTHVLTNTIDHEPILDNRCNIHVAKLMMVRTEELEL